MTRFFVAGVVRLQSQSRRPNCRGFLLAVALLLQASIGYGQNAPETFFEKRIRPLLVSECIRCHGPKEQENDLRLDSRSAMLKGGKSGPALVPRMPSKSLLIKAVRHVGKLKMPPDKRLSNDQVRYLSRWIKSGAVWPKSSPSATDTARRINAARRSHWAYQPIAKVKPPKLRDDPTDRSAIDRFVISRLEAKGLTLSQPASRRTLIRRVYSGLLGLPPPYSEVRRFVNDKSPNAFARLVDRLLERKEYGQHWARHWLDVARYSDTTGYQESAELRFPFSYTYRDYVVRSFNSDTPYNQFVQEQLAADQMKLAKDKQWKLAGMGFLTLGPRFNYNRHDIIDDRIDVVTRGLLGLTVTCSRCHDHKYDPILSADYYGLYGVFASSYEPWNSDLPKIGSPAEDDFDTYRKFRTTLRNRDTTFKDFHAKTHQKILHEMRAYSADYLWYIVQQMPEHRTKTQVSFDTKRIHLRGPTPYGPGGIVRWQHEVKRRGETDVVFGLWNQLAQLKAKGFGLAAAKIIARSNRTNAAVRDALVKTPPQSMLDVAKQYGTLLESVYRRWERLKKIDPDVRRFGNVADEQLRQVLYADDSPVAMNADEAREAYTDPEFNRYMSLKRQLDNTFVKFRSVVAPRAMVLLDRKRPEEPRVFARGKSTRPGDFTSRRFLRVLAHVDGGKPYRSGSGRRALARAIVDPGNPLTARVIVNRVWMWHFGHGLVETASDFGSRGNPPSHPRLLDWLARSFMENGWSLKQLHRTIMLSATYQQKSVDRKKPQRVDPRNRLLWRMNRKRLQFEEMRDALLQAGGRLDTQLNGPPIREFSSSRRSLYLFVDRQHLAEVRRVFDFPSPDISAAQRAQTTIPQQSLFLMNNGFTTAIAKRIATQIKAKKSDRIRMIYQRLFSRPPISDETKLGRRFLENESLERYIHTLLMTNEFMFVD